MPSTGGWFRSAFITACTATLIAAGGVAAKAQEPAPPPAAPPADIQLDWGGEADPNARATFESGACAGFIGDPRVVNGFLEYSLHSTCTGTGWWPHRLTMVLQTKRSTQYFPDIFYKDSLTDRSRINQEGSMDITVFIAEPCIDTQERTYRIKGKIEAGEHTAQGLGREVTVNCRVLNS